MKFLIFLILNFELEDYLNAIKFKTPASEYAKDSIIKMGEKVLPDLFKIVKNKKEDVEYRIEICNLIGKIKSKNSIPVLVELLKESHPGLRKEAVKAIGELKDTSCLKYIVKMLDDPHDIVRREAIIAIKKTEDKRAINFLRRMLLKERDYSNISEILRALGDLKAKEALKEIFNFLKFKEENIKISSIYAIGEIGEINKEIVDTFLNLLENGTDYIKREVIISLGKIKCKEAVQKIAKFLNSPNRTLKFEAIKSLSNIESDSSLIFLINEIFDPDKEIRDFVKEIIKNREKIGEKLENIIYKEKDLKTKKGAFEILKEIYKKEELIYVIKKIFPDRKNEIYELILKGEVKEGMSEDEVFLSKGEPKRVAFYKEKNKKEWEYEDKIIEFKQGKVTKIKKIPNKF
jgi:HEAT repeat protein